MNYPTFLQILNGRADYRPEGSFSLPDGIEMIRQAIAFSREQKISQLLINTTQLDVDRPVGTFKRFQIGETLAFEGGYSVNVAFVARPDQIDLQHFVMIVAKNRGLHTEVFTTEAEALAWLLRQPAL